MSVFIRGMDSPETKLQGPMKAFYVIVPAFVLIGEWSRDWNQHRSFLYILISSVFFLAVYSLIIWGVSRNRNLK
jgi:membrane protein DedA with SNARE-associated domain